MRPMKVYAFSPSEADASGRAMETIERIRNRVARVVESYPNALVVPTKQAADVVVQIGSSQSSVTRRPLDRETTRVVKYSSGVPGSAARLVGDALHSVLQVCLADERSAQVVASGKILAEIERLTADLHEALDENDELRQALHEAHIEKKDLEERLLTLGGEWQPCARGGVNLI